MPAPRYAQRQDAVDRVLDMQSQAAVAAAAGLTVERDTWYELDVLVAVANELEPAALHVDKKLEEVATTLRDTRERAGLTGVTAAVFEQALLMARAPNEVLEVRGTEEKAGAACLLMRQDGSVFSLDVVAAAAALESAGVEATVYKPTAAAAVSNQSRSTVPTVTAQTMCTNHIDEPVRRPSTVNGSTVNSSCVMTARRITVDVHAQRPSYTPSRPILEDRCNTGATPYCVDHIVVLEPSQSQTQL